MKIPIAKIEDITEPDHDALSNVYFDKEHNKLIATDGFGMVVIPVDSEDEDVSGCVPAEVVKFARGCRADIKLHNSIEARVETADGRIFQQRRHEGYPVHNVRDIVSKVLATEADCTVVSLDAKRLIQLTEALLDFPQGIYGITLKIYTEKDPILIRPHRDNWDDRFGIILPMLGGEEK